MSAPVSPTVSDAPQPPKRKPNRRANTAERRATHNAVERQRRETLNGRFLDLAALLPNLATVRRPSKSAIVNSSIAIIHAHRRRITTSSRALRSIKQESDALRRELNEWRARANLPRVDEPPRGDDFEQLMMVEDDWENSAQEERRAYEMVAAENATDDDDALFPADDFARVQQQQQQPVLIQHSPIFDPEADKVAAWNAQQLYSALQQQQQQQQWSQPFSPQQQQFYQRVPALFGVEDDASSVGSSEHSAGASPHASYELAPAGFPTVDAAFPRRPSISIPPANWIPQQPVRAPVSVGGGSSSFHPMAWMM